MNKWAQKTIKLATGAYYLDRLLKIYPPEDISRGLLVEKESRNLRKLFEKKKRKELIKELIRLKEKKFKFPIENPYIGFLSFDKTSIDKNPVTLQKICDSILNMDYNNMVERLETPKKASRRIGPMFKIWLKKKFVFKDSKAFELADLLAFLNGSDTFLKNYAEQNLSCKFSELSKGLDFIAKIKKVYIIGTTKFITDAGGGQTGQFYEAMQHLKKTKCPSNVQRVAVIDGVAWIVGKMKKILTNLANNEHCFSALLLNEFINKIK